MASGFLKFACAFLVGLLAGGLVAYVRDDTVPQITESKVDAVKAPDSRISEQISESASPAILSKLTREESARLTADTLRDGCGSLGIAQLESFFRASLSLENGRLRDMALSVALQSLSKLSPRKAWELMPFCPPYIRDSLAREIASHLGETEGGGAIGLILASKSLLQPIIQANDAFNAWSEKNPDAAAQWLGETMVAKHDHATSEWIDQFLQNAPSVVASRLLGEVVVAIERGDDRYSRHIDSLTFQWALEQPDAALTWAKSIGSGAIRDRMLRGAASGALESDGGEAKAMAAVEGASFHTREAITRQIAEKQAKENPEGARAWANSIQNPFWRAKAAAVVESKLRKP